MKDEDDKELEGEGEDGGEESAQQCSVNVDAIASTRPGRPGHADGRGRHGRSQRGGRGRNPAPPGAAETERAPQGGAAVPRASMLPIDPSTGVDACHLKIIILPLMI